MSIRNSHLLELDSSLFCETLKELHYLQTLSIVSERFSENYFNDVCTSLCNHQFLRDFQWSDATIGDISCFGAFFRTCPNLHNIKLTQIMLSEEWIQFLIQILDESWKMENLEVNHVYTPLMNKISRNAERAKLKSSMPSLCMYDLVQNLTKT